MEYRTFSPSITISRIAAGCMSLPAVENDYTRLIAEAVDLGINYFDTADLYQDGLNEILLGKALKGRRSEVIIATKGGNVLSPDNGHTTWDASPKHLLDAVEASLKRLDTDHIDFYQLHGGTISDDIPAVVRLFENLHAQGKIIEYGISSIRPNVIRKFIETGSLAGIMMQYSLLDRRPEETVFPLLREKGIPVLCRGALTSGLLVDKPARNYLKHSAAEVEKAKAAVEDLVRHNRTKAAVLLQFALAEPAIISAVTGFRSSSQLKEIVGSLYAPQLSLLEIQTLKDSIAALNYEEHR